MKYEDLKALPDGFSEVSCACGAVGEGYRSGQDVAIPEGWSAAPVDGRMEVLCPACGEQFPTEGLPSTPWRFSAPASGEEGR